MHRYSEGDWVQYRHHEGWTTVDKVLEVRPDGKLVVGQHDKDPESQHDRTERRERNIVTFHPKRQNRVGDSTYNLAW